MKMMMSGKGIQDTTEDKKRDYKLTSSGGIKINLGCK